MSTTPQARRKGTSKGEWRIVEVSGVGAESQERCSERLRRKGRRRRRGLKGVWCGEARTFL